MGEMGRKKVPSAQLAKVKGTWVTSPGCNSPRNLTITRAWGKKKGHPGGHMGPPHA